MNLKGTSNLFKIACRNVIRSKKRTLLTALAICIGITVSITVRGLLNGLQGSIVTQTTESETGDIQIHHHELMDSIDMLPLHLNMKLDQKLKKAILADAAVKRIAGRIAFAGLISNEARDRTTTYFGRAIDVKNEPSICPLMKNNILKGTLPRQQDGLEIAVAQKLAQSMNLEVGSDVAVTAQTESGAMNAYDFKVVGIFESKLAMSNKKLIYMPLGTAQLLLDMEQKVTEIILDIDDLDSAHALSARLQGRLDKAGYSVEVNAWDEIAKTYATMMFMQNIIFGTICVVLFILVLTGVINTMLMTVFERTREIGTMMAFGVKRRRVLLMFLFESVTIGLIGSSSGALLGLLIVSFMHYFGLSFSPAGTDAVTIIHPYVEPYYILLAVFIALFGALIAALYPAWRASHLKPAEAIRTL